MNNAVGCARVSQLPNGLAPVQTNGVSVLRSGLPAWLPVQTLGSLTVQPFRDNNGNGVWDAGEPFLSGFIVAINIAQLTTGPNGAAFNLGEGVYQVNATPAAGYQVMIAMPQTVVVTQGGAATLRIPAQIAGGIHGQVRTSGTAVGWPGVTIELRNLNTNETRLAVTSNAGCANSACWTAGNYSFQNVTPGAYRLRLLNIPAGFLSGEEPVINYNAGQTVQQNLLVYPAGAVSGLVYHDNNFNGVQNSGEQGTAEYSLILLNDAGASPQTIQPAANGTFNLTGLQAGVFYALTLDPASADGGLGTAVTETPGWFTLSSQPLDLRVGLYAVPTIEEQFTRNRYNGLVYTGPWYNRVPVAGARIIAYLWQESFPAAAGCDQDNPGVLAEAFTDGNGRYHLFAPLFPQLDYCLAVVDTPGVTQSTPVIVKAYGGWPTSGGGYHYQPRTEQRDIALEVDSSQYSVVSSHYSLLTSHFSLFTSHASLSWAAFRDDNGNGEWDGAETALAGVEIGVNGLTAVSGPDGTGATISLPDGEHLLTITPPPGYAVVGPAARTLYINGADVILPPIALRVSGVFIGTVFADNDGDGRQGVNGNERGIGGVTVQISGPANTSVVTDLSGRFHLPNLPDGNYTVTVTPPDGYVSPPPQSVTLADGGLIGLPLQPVGPVVGVIYEDWDGDGRRAADEPLLQSAISVTLGSEAETVLTAGQFLFWQPAPGSYELAAIWGGVAPQTITVGPNSGGGLALTSVDEGIVRGTIWHDANGDGRRQPWELPLAGIAVTLNGQSVATDEHGRFVFYAVAPGSYGLTADLPEGLTADIGSVTVTATRGAAVGIAAVADQPGDGMFRLYLPVVVRP
jgi:hypothetical protein